MSRSPSLALSLLCLTCLAVGCSGDPEPGAGGGATDPGVASVTPGTAVPDVVDPVDTDGATSPAAAGKLPPEVAPGFADDFEAVALLRPARFLKNAPFLSLIPDEVKNSALEGPKEATGIDIRDIESVAILLAAPDGPPTPEMMTAVVRFNKPADIKAFLSRMAETSPAEFQKVRYFVAAKEGRPAAFLHDEFTMVFAAEKRLQQLISSRDTTPSSDFAKQLASADLNKEAVVIANLDRFKQLIRMLVEDEFPPGAPQAGAAMTFVDMVSSVALSLDMSGESLLNLQVTASDEDAANQVNEMAEGLLANGKAMANDAIGDAPASLPGPLVESATNLATEFLAGIGLSRNGTTVTLDIKRPGGIEAFEKTQASAIQAAIAAGRQTAMRMQKVNNLRMIGLAFFNSLDQYRHFPTGIRNEKGELLLSWRVQLLPYLEQQTLYEQFHLDEPWDSEHNKTLIARMPEIYAPLGSDPALGKTVIHCFGGEGAPMNTPKVRIQDITDGTVNTILCIEAGMDRQIDWTRPDHMPFKPENPLPVLGKVTSPINVLFFDGRVEQIEVPDAERLKKMITHQGGEVLND